MVFGFGKKAAKPRFTIDQPSDAVSNIIFLTAENAPNTVISVGLHKNDGTYLDTCISMFNDIVDDELFETMKATFNKLTNIDNPTALRTGIVIINSDIDEAERIYTIIKTLPSRFYLSTFGAVISDGTTWKDMVLGTTGDVDRSVFTDYQAYNLSTDEKLEPYNPRA